jgi:hypothetical protein
MIDSSTNRNILKRIEKTKQITQSSYYIDIVLLIKSIIITYLSYVHN